MDELQLVRDLRDDSAPREGARVLAERALREAYANARHPTPKRAWRPRLVLSAATVATVAAVAVLATGVADRDVQPQSAQAALNEAAASARNDATFPLGSDDAFYTKSRLSNASWRVDDGSPTDRRMFHQIYEEWTSRDDVVIRTSTPNGSKVLRSEQRSRFPSQFGPSLSYEQVLHLPSDSAALYRALVRMAGEGGRPAPFQTADQWVFGFVADVLQRVSLPPAQRAAMFETLGSVEGAVLTGVVKLDPRTGDVESGASDEQTAVPAKSATTVVLPTQRGFEQRLVFDPTTSEVLRFSISARAGNTQGLPAGELIWDRLVVDQGVVPASEIPVPDKVPGSR